MTKKLYTILLSLIIVFAALIRLVGLNQIPAGMYWEEVALGYDAYSILKTGKDHHGNNFPLVAFESFGDWKPSLYFYTAVPSVALFGLNVWGVRLPSVIAGLLIVVGAAQLVKLIKVKKSRLSALLAAFLAAISPWAIQFSRGAWETNLATALILWGVIFGLRFCRSKKVKFSYFSWSAVLLALSTYAYHAARISAPLLGLGLLILNWQQFKKVGWKKISWLFLLIITIMLPFVKQLGSTTVSQRAAETTIFSQIELIEQSNQLKQAAGNTWLARIFYHRYLIFTKQIMINFFKHFHLDFLFISGDANPRHSTAYFGQLYHLSLIGLIFGTIYLLVKRKRLALFLGFWLIVSILPAALTKTVPHSLRILSSMPIFIALTSLGWTYLAQRMTTNYKKLFFLGLTSLYLLVFFVFANYYSKVYPRLSAEHWQAGYEQVMTELKKLEAQYPDYPVYISRAQGRPAMYYWFYHQTNPKKVQAQNNQVKKDQGEFLEFEQVKFGIDQEKICQNACILALTGSELPKNNNGLESNSNVLHQQVYQSNSVNWHLLIKANHDKI